MTKVVQLQYRSSSSGDFARRLNDEFLKVGVDSSIITLYFDGTENRAVTKLGRNKRLIARLDNRIQNYLNRNIDKRFGLFSYPILGTDVAQMAQIKQADVIYLHWILFGFLNFKGIEKLAKLGKPVVVVLHDMWSITGGCHYSFSCEKYKNKCGDCQMFSGDKKNDWSTAGFDKKRKLYSKYKNLFFVSPSKWLYDCARASALTKDKPIFHIPNVLDRSIFKPFDKKTAKQILNIDPKERVIVFGAVSVDSPYKGWEYLKAALIALYQQDSVENISVLVFGGGFNSEVLDVIPFKTRFMGRLNDEYTVALVYNAADVFVAPSLADNLPYTIFEALACGTPVVAFNTGGIPDLIQHKVNGYLATYKDSEDIASGIDYCLKHTLEARPSSALDTSPNIQKHLELWDLVHSSYY